MADTSTTTQPHYAGFWIRFVAWVIDVIILMIPIAALSFAFPGAVDATTGVPVGPSLPTSLIGVAIIAAYIVLLESSAKQASLGKMALGLKVTTLDGARMGPGQAALRAWPYYLGGLAGAVDVVVGTGMIVTVAVGVLAIIAYLFIAFTSNKQGLHDKMAGTLVIRKK